jgi:hypothetical protein
MKIVLFVLLLAVSIAAQENRPKLFDELDNLPLDETIIRVENLAREIRNNPNSKALIQVSGGHRTAFTAPYNRGALMKAIWQNNLMNPAENLLIQFCRVNQGPLETKFFVVREKDKVETCDENSAIPKETILFDNVAFYYPEFKLRPLENLPVEHGFSDGEYSQFALNVLKRLLNDSPGSKVCVIGYLKTNFEEAESGKIITKPAGLDKKAFAQKMMRAAKNELLKNGVAPSRIVTLDGGYVNGNERRLDFWFVPAGGAIPIPKPDYVPGKSNAK